ncbi:MAG: BlaI/MecI/CopY family transcriptional regulator [Bacteroidetes bacterium]|nr:MAG: BlaI/MecI/CopY family transcriptional regulator [Bacteroidota bacterium]
MEIPKPTESELQVLQVLWQNGASTVRFVNDEIAKQKTVGYTTTLKIMQMMTEKGLLKRVSTDEKAHIFEAAISEQETQQKLLDKFLDATFKGSAMKLVMQALGNHQTSQNELDEIKKLIEQIEKNK